jgi:putative transposase
MSRFCTLSQTIWHCQYHIVWTPKYRYRILSGDIAQDVDNCVHDFSERVGCEVTEMKVQADLVHLLAMVPPKVSISDYLGTIKGRTAIRIFNKYKDLRQKPYWGNQFTIDFSFLRLVLFARSSVTRPLYHRPAPGRDCADKKA